MTSITAPDLLTIIYVLVDDWYQAHGIRLLKGKPGAKPEFSDSEVITLLLAMDFIPFPSETQFLGFIRANYLALFPRLVDQSQFNRRARALRLLVEELRRTWLVQLGIFHHTRFLLDTKPVPVVGVKRSNRHSDFAGSASYGYCPSRNMKYFGYKLVAITTFSGIPVVYELVPAHTDEREAAEAVLAYLRGCQIIGDKGFIGMDWQAQVYAWTQNQIWTPKRSNQVQQNSKALDRWLISVRERIEGVFHELTNTGRDLEGLLAKTLVGLCTRVIAKMASHALKHVLNIQFGIKVQTFEIAASAA
jgi:Transposase DDE domain